RNMQTMMPTLKMMMRFGTCFFVFEKTTTRFLIAIFVSLPSQDDSGDNSGDENDESDFDDHSYVSETEYNENNSSVDADNDLNRDILIDSDAADEDYVESEGDDEEENPVSKKRAVKVSTASASTSV